MCHLLLKYTYDDGQPKSPTCFFALSLTGLIAFGCSEEDTTPELPDLKIYLDRFEEEARLRGYDLDLSEVEAVYVDEIEINGYTSSNYGYSNYQGTGVRKIEIAKTLWWKKSNDISRESLFFHEIGHAFLHRFHDECKLCDGTYMSVMNYTRDNYRNYFEKQKKKNKLLHF